MAKIKSQWEIVTRNARAPRFDPGKPHVSYLTRNLDLAVLEEQARKRMNQVIGERANKSCRCHGKCECALKELRKVSPESFVDDLLRGLDTPSPEVVGYRRKDNKR